LSRRGALIAAGLGCAVLGLAGLGWWAGWGRSARQPARPAAPGDEQPLPSELADQALPLLFERLETCARAEAGPACQGRPLLSFRLRSEAGVAALGELRVRSGELSSGLLACLGRAVGDIRLASPRASGELRVEVPVGCGPDGRVRPLPIHAGRTHPPAETHAAGQP